MIGREIIKRILLEHGVPAEDFFGRSRCPKAVEARKAAIPQLSAAGFSRGQIARLMKKHPDTIRYWQKPSNRADRMVRNARYWETHLRRPPPPIVDHKAIIAAAILGHGITEAEFFGDELNARVTEARRDAIVALSKAGLKNRAIATCVKRHIHTVRYWLNPDNRIRRIRYKINARITRHRDITEQQVAHVAVHL